MRVAGVFFTALVGLGLCLPQEESEGNLNSFLQSEVEKFAETGVPSDDLLEKLCSRFRKQVLALKPEDSTYLGLGSLTSYLVRGRAACELQIPPEVATDLVGCSKGPMEFLLLQSEKSAPDYLRDYLRQKKALNELPLSWDDPVKTYKRIADICAITTNPSWFLVELVKEVRGSIKDEKQARAFVSGFIQGEYEGSWELAGFLFDTPHFSCITAVAWNNPLIRKAVAQRLRSDNVTKHLFMLGCHLRLEEAKRLAIKWLQAKNPYQVELAAEGLTSFPGEDAKNALLALFRRIHKSIVTRSESRILVGLLRTAMFALPKVSGKVCLDLPDLMSSMKYRWFKADCFFTAQLWRTPVLVDAAVKTIESWLASDARDKEKLKELFRSAFDYLVEVQPDRLRALLPTPSALPDCCRGGVALLLRVYGRETTIKTLLSELCADKRLPPDHLLHLARRVSTIPGLPQELTLRLLRYLASSKKTPSIVVRQNIASFFLFMPSRLSLLGAVALMLGDPDPGVCAIVASKLIARSRMLGDQLLTRLLTILNQQSRGLLSPVLWWEERWAALKMRLRSCRSRAAGFHQRLSSDIPSSPELSFTSLPKR